MQAAERQAYGQRDQHPAAHDAAQRLGQVAAEQQLLAGRLQRDQ
jgi:hypothetical protein